LIIDAKYTGGNAKSGSAGQEEPAHELRRLELHIELERLKSKNSKIYKHMVRTIVGRACRLSSPVGGIKVITQSCSSANNNFNS